MLNFVLAYVQEKKLYDLPAIGMYYYCYLALTENQAEKHFQQFKQLLLTKGQEFPKEELRDLFLLATNFCTRQYNAGNPNFLKDLFDLYKEGLAKSYLFTENRLSRFTFRNIVTLGLITKEHDWVEQFIHQYYKKIEKAYQESMYSYCSALLAYNQKNYTSALGLLQKSEFKDPLLNLSAKTVLLKIFFELQEYDLLESHLDAMSIFLRRKEFIGYHRDVYKNTIRYTRKLLEVKPYDYDAAKRLVEEIKNISTIAEREWLLNQLGGNE